MRYPALKPASVVVLLLVLTMSAFSAQRYLLFHTPPDKWKEARHFHAPFPETYESRIILSNGQLSAPPRLKVFSPNGAYWVGVDPDEGFQLRDSQPKGVQFHVSSPDVPICVFNERPKLITLTLKDHYPNFLVDVRWINEKLLFVSVWWGRVLGTHLILDVEKETIVFKEMVNDGVIAFQQWQQKGLPNKRIKTDQQ